MDGWVKCSLGHTDLCIGHCHAPLGCSDIGSLFEEFRWHSKRDGRQCGSKWRNGKPEFRSRFSDQGGHGVFNLRTLQTEIIASSFGFASFQPSISL
jgi:hypothetical protein